MNLTDREAVIDQTTGKDVLISRILNALPERVFDAFTDPDQVAKWWGPNGFTNTIHEMDVRPGGVWRFTMHGPDGRNYSNRIVFTEIVKPELLVYEHSGEDETADIKFHVTVTFHNQEGKTRITMRSAFDSAEILQKVVKEFHALEGATQNMNRLEEYLDKTGEGIIL